MITIFHFTNWLSVICFSSSRLWYVYCYCPLCFFTSLYYCCYIKITFFLFIFLFHSVSGFTFVYCKVYIVLCHLLALYNPSTFVIPTCLLRLMVYRCLNVQFPHLIVCFMNHLLNFLCYVLSILISVCYISLNNLLFAMTNLLVSCGSIYIANYVCQFLHC